MLVGIAAEIKNEAGVRRYRECALEALRLLAVHPTCPSKVEASDGLQETLVRARIVSAATLLDDCSLEVMNMNGPALPLSGSPGG